MEEAFHFELGVYANDLQDKVTVKGRYIGISSVLIGSYWAVKKCC